MGAVFFFSCCKTSDFFPQPESQNFFFSDKARTFFFQMSEYLVYIH